ncbi:uncharacterized protein LOC120076265 [Benincasa hispida]|uniref:uncharacterized protein LOC120076265 n=1 Tax=Benincasa hispida TaxID=102211 RepID=UPI001900CE65|nr:uncharacterized protein LOC120076265 [Benincasa hispida]
MQGLSLDAKNLKDFWKYDPHLFDGSLGDPTKAKMWLSSIETIFRFMWYPEEQKLQCTVFILIGNVEIWWRSAENMIDTGGELATWEQLKERFYENHRGSKDKEIHLGPRGGLRGIVHALDLKMYVAALRAAMRVDVDSQVGEEYRRSLGIGTSIGQKRKKGHMSDRCSRRNAPEHRDQPVSSFKGGPSRQQQQGRVFSTTRHEAEKSGIMVISTLPILGHYALVLFDSGSSHSFISAVFVRHAMIDSESFPFTLSISTPSGEFMLDIEKIKACQVEVANRALDVTLIILDIRDFDVLLGIDWLATNHASIDCSHKQVIFNPPTGASFKFRGVGTVVLPIVISALKTGRLYDQVAWGFMASVVDTRETEVTLTLEPVVRDFPDVFPEDLLGLPPQREVDFAIELEPGTTSISKAPYTMAPAELKELKFQLQELLDKWCTYFVCKG